MYHSTVEEAEGGLFDTFASLGLPAIVAGRDNRNGFRIVRLNAAFRGLGIDIPTEDQGAFAGIVPPRLAVDLRGACRKVLSTGRSETIDSALVIDGDLAWWRLTVSLCDTVEELVLITAQDITDLKTAVHDLFKTSAELREGADATAKLAATAAVGIRDMATLLDVHDPPAPQVTDCASSAADRAMMAVDCLLARIEAQTSAAHRYETIQLDQVCADIAAIVDPTGRVDIVYPEARIQADPTVLHVCLRNLMGNAARYAQGMVEISLYESMSGDGLCLSVADDGPGFGKSADPFHGTGGDRSGLCGSGPGAIMRLLSSVGGSLSPLPPRLGRGATMQMMLPGRVFCHGVAG